MKYEFEYEICIYNNRRVTLVYRYSADKISKYFT